MQVAPPQPLLRTALAPQSSPPAAPTSSIQASATDAFFPSVVDRKPALSTPAAQALAGPPATLSASASPLMRAIFDAATRFTGRGTVPARYLASERNVVEPEVLFRGPKIFRAARELIAGAQSEVLFQSFEWDRDSHAAKQIEAGLQELEGRARAENRAKPVRVYLLVNTELLTKSDTFDAMKADIDGLKLDPRFVEVALASHRHLGLDANHSKTFVVDGEKALVTGANVEACHNPGVAWFDAGYRLRGEVAKALREDFEDVWRECTGDYLRKLRPTPELPASGVPMLVLTRRKDGNPFSSDVANPLCQGYLAAFANAKQRIRIQTPNLNDNDVKDSLVAALSRGVEVQLILSKGFNDSQQRLPTQGGTNAKSVEDLLDRARAAGAQSRLSVRWYSEDGKQPVEGNVSGASHAKYASIDGQVAIVGSCNMDTQSWNHSRELNVFIDGAEVARAFDAQLFEKNFARAIPV